VPNDLPDWTLGVAQKEILIGGPWVINRDGAQHANTTAVLPVGIHSLLIHVSTSGSISNLKVNGLTSGTNYLALRSGSPAYVANPNTTVWAVPVNVATDSQFVVTITTLNLGATVTAWAVAVPQPVGIFAFNHLDGVLHVTSEDNPQGTLLNPHPWQAPTAFPKMIGQALARNTAAIIIPASGTQIIYLHTVSLYMSAALGLGNMLLDDTTGVGIWRSNNTQTNFQLDFRGAPLVAGRGLRIHNVDGAVDLAYVSGHVSYSQA
jgi:hypothetical protein